jgi:hypothetical protein
MLRFIGLSSLISRLEKIKLSWKVNSESWGSQLRARAIKSMCLIKDNLPEQWQSLFRVRVRNWERPPLPRDNYILCINTERKELKKWTFKRSYQVLMQHKLAGKDFSRRTERPLAEFTKITSLSRKPGSL